MSYELVIRGGDVVDGSGLPRYRADVAIHGGRLVRIGIVPDPGDVEIDATGCVVTPGFIDGHTHMDAQVFWDSIGSCSCWHGVTTVVMGHCGFTLAPASTEQRHLVLRNLERAEDISPAALATGIEWNWTTFRQYLDVVDTLPKAINYAANIGHSALRTHVMGEAAFERESSSAELALMKTELADALRAGAWGLSTSRSSHHSTSDDRPVASRLASWQEVCELVGTMRVEGVGVFQTVEDPVTADTHADYDDRMISLARDTGVPILVPCLGVGPTTALLDRAAESGARIVGLTHSRGICAMWSFQTQLAFDRLEAWKKTRSLPVETMKSRLRDPEIRRQLVEAANHADYGNTIGPEARKPDYDNLLVLDTPLPPYRSVGEIARERSIDPVEALIDIALESDLDQFFVQPLMPYHYDDTRDVMKHPSTVMSFSDAGAHVSQISDCSVQTHLLAYWVRDRGEFTLEEAVRMLTLAPARAWGFHERGLLREGLVADINIFDPDTVGPEMPYVDHDLPAGALRIKQRASGFRATIVNGKVTIRDGEHTGALPGRLIRRQSSQH